MRGSRLCKLCDLLIEGIIPADAGLTTFSMTPPVPYRDHPRGCGAHLEVSMMTKEQTGSSPRMRGSHKQCGCTGSRGGIIPADAGLTLLKMRMRPLLRDHPRGCGAHLAAHPINKCLLGSSPRMRGSQGSMDVQAVLVGIIPADAGLTR